MVDERCHRIEAVRQFRVPGHTTDRNLRHCARQHRPGRTKSPQEETDPPPAGENCSNGPIDARQVADLVLKYRIGHFFIPVNAVVRCRSPPSRLNQNSDEKRANCASTKK